MKKVLFPFENGRTCYKEAYVYAVKLTRNLGAELIMLSAFDIEVDNTITTRKYDILIKNSWLKAYQEIILFHDYYLKDHARADGELRVKTDHRIIHGDLMEEFSKILNTEKIDLVVMPASSETDSTRKKLRLMRRETLDMNQTSLLVAPSEKTFQPINNILFTFGLKRLKGLTNHMGELSLFASLYNSSIHFVHLSKHAKDARLLDEKLMESVRNASTEIHPIIFHSINSRDLGDKLLEYISDNEIEMVAIARQQIDFLGDIYSKGIFQEMSSNVRIPVLILRDSDPVKE